MSLIQKQKKQWFLKLKLEQVKGTSNSIAFELQSLAYTILFIFLRLFLLSHCHRHFNLKIHLYNGYNMLFNVKILKQIKISQERRCILRLSALIVLSWICFIRLLITSSTQLFHVLELMCSLCFNYFPGFIRCLCGIIYIYTLRNLKSNSFSHFFICW